MFDVEMRHDLLVRIAVRQHHLLMASSGVVVRFGEKSNRWMMSQDYMQFPTIVGFPDFSGFSPWWEVSKTDTFSLSYVFCRL